MDELCPVLSCPVLSWFTGRLTTHSSLPITSTQTSKMGAPRIGADAGPCTILFAGSALCLIGTVKGIVNILFAALYALVPSTVIALVYTPKVCTRAYATILYTPLIGPNLKTLALLTVWAAVLLWPVLVVLLSLAGGICVGFACPLIGVFDSEEWLLAGGFARCYEEITNAVKELFRWESEALDRMCDALIHPPAPTVVEPGVNQPDPVPFDISFLLLTWCSLVGLACGLMGGLTCTVIIVVLWLPCVPRLYVEMWLLYWSDGCTCWQVVLLLPFLIANLLLLPLTVLGATVLVVLSFLYMCKGGVECYENGAESAIKEMRVSVSECWSAAMSFAFYR